MQVRSLDWEDPLEEEMATHSGILTWRIPWMKEPGELQSMGSQESGMTAVTKQSFVLSEGERQTEEGLLPWVSLASRYGRRKKVKSLSCVQLCDPVDCSPPGSSVHGILQARILEWVAISFSRGSFQPRDRSQVSHTAGRLFTIWSGNPLGGAYKRRDGIVTGEGGVWWLCS